MGISRTRLQPPPREIGPLLAAQMLFGGPVAQIGWLIFAFGSIFFWLFAWHADLSAWRFRADAIAAVEGHVTGCSDTHYAEGGSRSRGDTPVYENRYRYTVGGLSYEGRSYSTGTCLSNGPATVEYLLERPTVSRLRRMRYGLLSGWAAVAAVLPLTGLVMAVVSLRSGGRRIRLLRDGLPADGRIVESSITGGRVMGRPVYRVTLQFTAGNGSTRATTVETCRPESLEDDGEVVLYHPEDSRLALPVDSLPGNLVLDDAGRFVPASSRAYLILPLAGALINWWFARSI